MNECIGRLGLEAYVRVYAPEAERNRSVLRTHLAGNHPALNLVADMDVLTLHHAVCLLKADKAAFLASFSTNDAGGQDRDTDHAAHRRGPYPRVG